MIESYWTIEAELEHEIDKVKGSRFRATVAPAQSAEEALAVVERVRKTYHDARHHGFAYRLGPDGSELRYADDGEPSGSTGKPILAELEGRQLTYVVAVVTRWFGGTKLGVGGLVRAYGGAAGAALDRARRKEVKLTRRVRLRHAYELSGPVEGLLAELGLRPSGSEYAEDVELTLDVPLKLVAPLLDAYRDRTAGRGRAEAEAAISS